MQKLILASLLSGAVAGCASSTPAPPGSTSHVNAVATPVYAVLKAPVCVATVLIAAPLAGITAFAQTEESQDLRQGLDDGIAQNCGPPYTLEP